MFEASTFTLATGHTLRLFLIEDAEGGRVVLYGDRDKEVYRGTAERARAVYAEEKQRYEARVRDGDPEPQPAPDDGAFPVASA